MEPEKMSPLVTSLIRSFVPMLAGAIATFLLSHGIELDAQTSSGLVGFLTALFSFVYYALARLLETSNPKFGFLLGIAKQPLYTNKEMELKG